MSPAEQCAVGVIKAMLAHILLGQDGHLMELLVISARQAAEGLAKIR